MPKWIEYVLKKKPADEDMLMLEDAESKSNKRVSFSGIADWLIEKMKKNNLISGALRFKGSSAYAALPGKGAAENDYYYCTDGDGTHGPGYYAWNGSSWIWIGNNDKGIDKSLKVEGAAAEAAATGEAIASLKEDTDDLNKFCKKQIIKKFNSAFEPSKYNSAFKKVLNVNIPSGQPFTVFIKDENGIYNTTYISVYKFESSEKALKIDTVQRNIEQTLVFNEEITGISLYSNKKPNNGEAEIVVSYALENENSLEERIEKNEINKEIITDLKNINYKKSSNLFNLTFENGNLSGNDFFPLTSGVSFASTKDFIEVDNKLLYTIQCVSPLKYTVLYIFQYDKNYKVIDYESMLLYNNEFFTKTLMFGNTCNYLRFKAYREGEPWENIVPTNIQLEQGNVATDYKTYGSEEAILPMLEKTVDKLVNGFLPNYYDNYIEKKITIIENMLKESSVDGDAFYFITDMHWDKNAQNSPEIISRMNKKLRIDKVFTGGDLTLNGYANSPLKELRDASLSPRNVYAISGNHEFLGENTTYSEIYYMQSSLYDNDVHFGDMEKNYYYVDNSKKKIRYIILASYGEAENGASVSLFTDDKQLNWFAETALNVTKDWTVVIFTHSLYAVPLYSDGTWGDVIEQPTQKNNGFTNVIKKFKSNGGTIACIIQGHLHLDRIFSVDGMPQVVCTTCDKYLPWIENGVVKEPWISENRKINTVTEQAFDVVILNKKERKVSFVRIGCPADNGVNKELGDQVEIREITY